MLIAFELTDQIPSGKNQVEDHYNARGKKVRHGNDRFARWRETAGKELLMQRSKWPMLWKGALPLRGDLIVTISYRPLDKTGRDITGMQDALWHLLEHMEMIENDGQIKGLTWEYPWRTEGPCVVMKIETTT